jgi:hypothetical protein
MGHHQGIQSGDPQLRQILRRRAPQGTGLSANVLPAGIHQHPEGASFPQLLHENGVAVAHVDKMQSQHGITCAG